MDADHRSLVPLTGASGGGRLLKAFGLGWVIEPIIQKLSRPRLPTSFNASE